MAMTTAVFAGDRRQPLDDGIELFLFGRRRLEFERPRIDRRERLEDRPVWPARELDARTVTDFPARVGERFAKLGDQPRLADTRRRPRSTPGRRGTIPPRAVARAGMRVRRPANEWPAEHGSHDHGVAAFAACPPARLSTQAAQRGEASRHRNSVRGAGGAANLPL